MDAAGRDGVAAPGGRRESVLSRALSTSQHDAQGLCPSQAHGSPQVSAGGSNQGKCFLIYYQNGNGKDGQGRQSERMFWKCLLTMTT